MNFLLLTAHARSTLWEDVYGPERPTRTIRNQRYMGSGAGRIGNQQFFIDNCQFYLISINNNNNAPIFISQSRAYKTAMSSTSFYRCFNKGWGGCAFLGKGGGAIAVNKVCASFSRANDQGSVFNINRINEFIMMINMTTAFSCICNKDATLSCTYGRYRISYYNSTNNQATYGVGLGFQELATENILKFMIIANNRQTDKFGLIDQYNPESKNSNSFTISHSIFANNQFTNAANTAVFSYRVSSRNPTSTYTITDCNIYNNRNMKFLAYSNTPKQTITFSNSYSDNTRTSLRTPMRTNSLLSNKIDLSFELHSTENCIYIPPRTPIETPAMTPRISPVETPSSTPSMTPEITPSSTPSMTPEITPSSTPSITPEITPSSTPSTTPEFTPSSTPSMTPEFTPSSTPSTTPEITPSSTPSTTPENTLSSTPSTTPENTLPSTPSITPELTPSSTPELTPSLTPELTPSSTPQTTPVDTPSTTPETTPIETLSSAPQTTPLTTSTETPSTTPNTTPSETPSETPSTTPQITPTETPSTTPNPSEVEIPAVIPAATAVQTVNPTPIMSPNHTNNGAISGESAVGVEDKGFQTIVQNKWFIIVIVGVIVILILALILAFIIFMIIPKKDDSSSYSESTSTKTEGELEEYPEQMDSGETMEISSDDPESPPTSTPNELENEFSEEVDSGETMEVSDGDIEASEQN